MIANRNVLAFFAAAATLTMASPARAQDTPSELPLCPASEEALLTYPPDFVRRGQSYQFTVERRAQRVSEVAVQTTQASEGASPVASTETLPFGSEDSIEAIRPSPAKGSSVGLRFSWVQDAGTPAACRGNDNYAEIRVVPQDAKLGTPALARVEGRYRVARRLDKSRPTWSLTPTCDFFGCATRVRSSGGLRGTFRADGDTGYQYEIRSRIGRCEVTENGRKVSWAIFSVRTIKVRPTRAVSGVAVTLTGSERYSESIPSDEYDVCSSPRDFVQRITLTRIGVPSE